MLYKRPVGKGQEDSDGERGRERFLSRQRVLDLVRETETLARMNEGDDDSWGTAPKWEEETRHMFLLQQLDEEEEE